MASTIWKGPITFGLVSFPVRLQKAARRERIALRYVRAPNADAAAESDFGGTGEKPEGETESRFTNDSGYSAPDQSQSEVNPVRQGYYSEGQPEPSSSADLQRGYEVAPDKFVVVRPEELKRLRKATSPDMQILRSVNMQEIDPVFLETSYYVIPGPGGEHAYGLFYQSINRNQTSGSCTGCHARTRAYHRVAGWRQGFDCPYDLLRQRSAWRRRTRD